MKSTLLFLAFSQLLITGLICQDDVFEGNEIAFNSIDGLEITADLYQSSGESGTYIILYHQANFSRGAYRTIAPKLTDLGYNCLAVDQRSGHKSRGVINKTCKRAIAADKKIRFINAVQDIEAAFLYVRDELKADKIIIWGSSYSASTVLYLGGKYGGDVEAILAFSPGEYFQIDEQDISIHASKIKAPVFITSAKKEKKDWSDMYNAIPAQKESFVPESGGFHGSKALWAEKKGNEAYWDAVLGFLDALKAN